MKDVSSPRPIESPLLKANGGSRVRHGFFTRQGGVSQGIYACLNVGLGSNDDPEHVRQNRARVAAWFGHGLERLATVHQVHSADVVLVDSDHAGNRPKADAMVSACPGVVLGVLSADCGPVLFSDEANGVIGAAHAGWKGAIGGVLENTIMAMEKLGADRCTITACLGPSIGAGSYEVGPEFIDRFVTYDTAYKAFFTPSPKEGHWYFNLPALTLTRLRQAGIEATSLALDTYPDEERFFSYRRTTHRGEPDYGRQISAIAITEE